MCLYLLFVCNHAVFGSSLLFVSRNNCLYLEFIFTQNLSLPIYVSLCADSEDEGVDTEEDEDTEKTGSTTARPRRLSELNINEKVKPIPPFSSLFILSPTNK